MTYQPLPVQQRGGKDLLLQVQAPSDASHTTGWQLFSVHTQLNSHGFFHELASFKSFLLIYNTNLNGEGNPTTYAEALQVIPANGENVQKLLRSDANIEDSSPQS